MVEARARRMLVAVAAALVLAACGSADVSAEVVSTSPATESTEATEPAPAEPDPGGPDPTDPEPTEPEPGPEPEPADVCATITPDLVAGALGGDAPAGETVTIAAEGDACVWRSGENVLGAAVVPPDAIPGEGEAADVFPLFGLDDTAYRSTSVRTVSGGDRSVLVLGGFTSDSPGDTFDATNAILDALSG